MPGTGATLTPSLFTKRRGIIARSCAPVLVALMLLAAPPGYLAAGAEPIPSAREVIEKDPAAGKLLDVPFVAQKDHECGPAVMAMALRYHGIGADADAIVAEWRNEEVVGTFTVDLLIVANRAGLDAHWIGGDRDKLIAEIGRDRPAVVFMNMAINPLPARHFALAVGYFEHGGKDYVVLHSGAEEYKAVPWKKFDRQWKRTGRSMMTIAPKPADEKAEPASESAGDGEKSGASKEDSDK